MSLTAFNRMRRMQQEAAMKPENIVKEAEEKEVVEPQTVAVEEVKEEAPAEEVKEEPKAEEETKTSARRGRRASN